MINFVTSTGNGTSAQLLGLADELLELDARQAITLYQVGKMVTASLDLETTLEAIAGAAHHLTGANSTALALLERDGRLVIRVGKGAVGASVGETLSADRGVTARAIRERRSILIDDMREEPSRARPELDERYGVRTFLAVPLTWRGEAMGVVTMAYASPRALGPKDVALAGALAEQAAAAVAHARDYAEEQRLRAESGEIARQLTEQAAQLERAQQQLVRNEKMTAIGQLVQGLAHEMNTPLSVVISNLSVLGRHAENLTGVAQAAQQALSQLRADPLAAALAGPLDAAVRDADLEYTFEDLPELLADLVRSMGTFARRDTGGPSPVAIQDVLDAALNLASNPLKHRARVMREYGDTPPAIGLGAELTELFLHLLINAAQALDEPGTVTIATCFEVGHIVVRIRDTGRGIPSEHLARVFDPFFTTRKVGEGAGIGLAVCYGIVSRHGGTINLDSQPGLGTTVTVSLPAPTTSLQVAA